MSSILVFPGQGSQFVGMGKELYDNYPAAREVFDAVDDALGQKLSEIIFNGPMDELTLTANVQPAIFAVSLAMLKASGAALPEFVAGHSLGEYSALCAAGALGVADTAKLLRLRGNAMQEAVPVGLGLTAVIISNEQLAISNLCARAESETGEIVDVANDNSPGQVVISGAKAAVERAMELAKEQGAKRAMPLQLSAPVHCRLQEPTASILRAAIAGTEFRAPAATFISNRTAAPMTDVSEIKESLVYQITHGVRWRETILSLPGLGITETVEVGPGNVLTGLTTRIVPELTARKLEI
ncbi:MAG: ACP S-malonyltransferase [Rickettsiales bacterium]|jgi:[acyl-carrier-protein] S-malonyltransferase|nr:ACP S-malonyltransferase [Rickettsiales bacterium]